MHSSSLVLLLTLTKCMLDDSSNVIWFLLLWVQVSMQNDEYGVQKYAYDSASFIIKCQNIWVMYCNCVVNHWTNIFSANCKFRSLCEHCTELFWTTCKLEKKRLALAISRKVMLQYKLLTKKKRLALAIFSKVMLQYKLLIKKKD